MTSVVLHAKVGMSNTKLSSYNKLKKSPTKNNLFSANKQKQLRENFGEIIYKDRGYCKLRCMRCEEFVYKNKK